MRNYDKRRQEILDKYGEFIRPIVGKGQLHESLLKGLDKILTESKIPKLEVKILGEPNPVLQEKVNEKSLHDFAKRIGVHKKVATHLYNILCKLTPIGAPLTNQTLLDIFHDNPKKNDGYGNVALAFHERYLEEKGLIDKMRSDSDYII